MKAYLTKHIQKNPVTVEFTGDEVEIILKAIGPKNTYDLNNFAAGSARTFESLYMALNGAK